MVRRATSNGCDSEPGLDPPRHSPLLCDLTDDARMHVASVGDRDQNGFDIFFTL